MNEGRANYLLRTLEALAELNAGGYRCNTEISATMAELMREVKPGVNTAGVQGVELAEIVFNRVNGDDVAMLSLQNSLDYVLGPANKGGGIV